MSGGTGHEAGATADRFAAAHRALKGDSSIQFAMRPAPPPPKTPQWLIDFGKWLERVLKPIGDLIRWINAHMPDAPYARIFLWSVIAIAAMAAIWLVWRRIRHGEWRLPRRRRAQVAAATPDDAAWAPAIGQAREWLREADALAAQGRYAEAVRHLLFRSVEDVAKRRPRLVRPALTSRELAAADAIPTAARSLFASIARLVERSLFGGQPLVEADWQAARAAYADFAGAGAWRG